MTARGRVPDFGKTKAAQTMGPCSAGVETALPAFPELRRPSADCARPRTPTTRVFDCRDYGMSLAFPECVIWCMGVYL